MHMNQSMVDSLAECISRYQRGPAPSGRLEPSKSTTQKEILASSFRQGDIDAFRRAIMEQYLNDGLLLGCQKKTKNIRICVRCALGDKV